MLTWLLVGIVLLIVEVLSLSFFILFFGLGAISVASLLYYWLLPLHLQVLLFAGFSLLYFVIFRKLLKKKKKLETHQELVGTVALVQEEIHPHTFGKVLIGDTSWKATAGTPIQKGSKVKVIAHHNLTLEVIQL